MTPFLYCVRHGQTDANKENRLLGRLDPPLNETGRAHAAHVAAWLSDKDITRIISSPLQRAAMTAQIISETTGAPVVIDPLLIELDFGDIDGMPIAEARQLGVYQERNRDRMAYRAPNGESYGDVLARVETLFIRDDIIRQETPIALVCHQGVARMIAAHLGVMPPEKAAYLPFDHENILMACKGPNNQIETEIVDISNHD